MSTWMTLDEARQQLGVRPQTIYAYVSRGRIAVSPDPADSRRSLYRADDVSKLVQRKVTGRTRETLAATTLFGAEPSVPTSISTFAGADFDGLIVRWGADGSSTISRANIGAMFSGSASCPWRRRRRQS